MKSALHELPESGKTFVPLGDVCYVSEEEAEKLTKFPRTQSWSVSMRIGPRFPNKVARAFG